MSPGADGPAPTAWDSSPSCATCWLCDGQKVRSRSGPLKWTERQNRSHGLPRGLITSIYVKGPGQNLPTLRALDVS